MKLIASVHEIKSSGLRLCISLRAKSLPDESRYSTILHGVEVPDTETARRTYYIGRRIEIEIKPL